MIFSENNAENIKELYSSIACDYEVQFGEKINKGVQALLNSEEFSRKRFDLILKKTLKIYQKRFNENYLE